MWVLVGRTGPKGGELLPKLLRPGALRSEEQRKALRSQAGAQLLTPFDLLLGTVQSAAGLMKCSIGCESALKFRSCIAFLCAWRLRSKLSIPLRKTTKDCEMRGCVSAKFRVFHDLDAPANTRHETHRPLSREGQALVHRYREENELWGQWCDRDQFHAGVSSIGDLGRLLEGLPRPLVDFLKVSAITRGAATRLGSSIQDRLRINATYALKVSHHWPRPWADISSIERAGQEPLSL